MSRVIVGALALLGWCALALQLWLMHSGQMPDASPLAITLRFFSYFTILTNVLVAAVLTAGALPHPGTGWLTRPAVRAATTAFIATVGIVYSAVLRSLWDPQGWQKLADSLLHDVMPVAYVAVWLCCWRTGTLRYAQTPLWLAFPLVYLAISLVAGARHGWYPYPFIDAGQLGYGQVLVNVVSILAGFLLLSALVVWLDKRRAPTR